MSRDELVEELLKLLDESSKLSDLTKKFDGFVSKYDKLYFENKVIQKYVILIYYKE